MPEEILATQDDLEQQSHDGSSTENTSSGNDDDFLVVDDRTKYRTREDAQKAYREAGQRISELSVWEKEIAQTYGVSDPRQIREWLEDYRKLREAAERQQAEANEKKPTGAGKTASDEELNPEEQKALNWIKKHADRLGFIPKEDLLSVQEQLKEQKTIIDQLQGNLGQASEARREELVEQGRGQLDGLLKEAGLTVTDDGKMRIENFIRNYVNSDEKLVTRWFGGQAKQVLAEAWNEYKALAGISSAKPNTSYAANKNQTRHNTPRPLPKPGSGRGNPNDAEARRLAAEGKKGITSATHDAAFALAQKHWEDDGQ